MKSPVCYADEPALVVVVVVEWEGSLDDFTGRFVKVATFPRKHSVTISCMDISLRTLESDKIKFSKLGSAVFFSRRPANMAPNNASIFCFLLSGMSRSNLQPGNLR